MRDQGGQGEELAPGVQDGRAGGRHRAAADVLGADAALRLLLREGRAHRAADAGAHHDQRQRPAAGLQFKMRGALRRGRLGARARAGRGGRGARDLRAGLQGRPPVAAHRHAADLAIAGRESKESGDAC